MEGRSKSTVRARLFLLLAALMALAAALAPASASAISGVPGTRHWQPPPRTAAWQWQLQGKIDPSFEAWAYDVDGFETSKAEVRALHRHRRRAICYLDVGSWENFRPDAGRFPRSVIGNRYEGFPNERWLDVSRYQLFEAPLKARIAMCARKRFDAVEPDNIAGWENKTGFEISRRRPAPLQPLDRRPGPRPRDGGGAEERPAPGRAAGRRTSTSRSSSSASNTTNAASTSLSSTPDKAVFEAEYELDPAKFCPAAAGARLQRDPQVLRPLRQALGALRRIAAEPEG